MNQKQDQKKTEEEKPAKVCGHCKGEKYLFTRFGPQSCPICNFVEKNK